jgi:hypothetical protein
MSWSMYMMGPKAKVVAEVEKSRGSGGDTSHHDAIQHAVLSVLNGVPEEATVVIEGNGHHDHHSSIGTSGVIAFSLKYKA